MDYPVKTRHSLESGTLFASTSFSSFASSIVRPQTRVIGKDLNQQFVGSLLELIDDTVIQGILVLLQPPADVVVHDTGIVSQTEMRGLAARLRGLGLEEGRRLAQVIGVEFVLKRLVRRFGEHRLFFQDGEDTHGLET